MEQLVYLDQDGVELRSDLTPATRRTRATAHRRGSPCAYARGPSTRSHDSNTMRLAAAPWAPICNVPTLEDFPVGAVYLVKGSDAVCLVSRAEGVHLQRTSIPVALRKVDAAQ